MPLTTGFNVINGLPIRLSSFAENTGHHVATPLQLELLETAINACAYDWQRFAAYSETGQVFVYLVDRETLAGLGGQLSFGEAPAPTTAPVGHRGDYGVFEYFNGFYKIYLLNTLDQDPFPYGGHRFFMETFIRLAGMAVLRAIAAIDPWQQDRLARAFQPVDRQSMPPMDDDRQDWGHWVWPWENNDNWAGTGRPEGGMWDSLDWWQDCWRVYPDGFVGGYPVGKYPTPSTAGVPIEIPWEARITEACAETFKDIYLPARFRAFNNRTDVRCIDYEAFVTNISDEIPMTFFGAYNFGGSRDNFQSIEGHYPQPTDPITTLQIIDTRGESGFIQIAPYMPPPRIIIKPGKKFPYLGTGGDGNLLPASQFDSWDTRINYIDHDAGDALTDFHHIGPYNDVVEFQLSYGSLQLNRIFISKLNGFNIFDIFSPPGVNSAAVTYQPLYGNRSIGGTGAGELFSTIQALAPTKGRPRYPVQGETKLHGSDSGTRPRRRPIVGSDAQVGEVSRDLSSTGAPQGPSVDLIATSHGYGGALGAFSFISEVDTGEEPAGEGGTTQGTIWYRNTEPRTFAGTSVVTINGY